jgi:hypothetical protein
VEATGIEEEDEEEEEVPRGEGSTFQSGQF